MNRQAVISNLGDENAAALVAKVALVIAKTSQLSADGFNDQTKSHYASISAHFTLVREAMAEQGLIIIPVPLREPKMEIIEYIDGKKAKVQTNHVVAEFDFVLTDGKAQIVTSVYIDAYNNKTITADGLMTTAHRKALQHLFMLPLSDDGNCATVSSSHGGGWAQPSYEPPPSAKPKQPEPEPSTEEGSIKDQQLHSLRRSAASAAGLQWDDDHERLMDFVNIFAMASCKELEDLSEYEAGEYFRNLSDKDFKAAAIETWAALVDDGGKYLTQPIASGEGMDGIEKLAKP